VISECPVPHSAFRIPRSKFRAVVMGASAGGFEAISSILSALPSDFALSVLVVQHLHPSDDGSFAQHLAHVTPLRVVEPCDKERIDRGCVYAAPANYHMLVERNGMIALSIDEKVNWSRPSVDVLLDSAVRAWGETVVAVILSGASTDGAKGMCAVKKAGGLTIAQDPASAEYPLMPQAAIDAAGIETVLPPQEIGELLCHLGASQQGGAESETGVGDGRSLERHGHG